MGNLLDLYPRGAGGKVTVAAGNTERVLDQANKGRELIDSIDDPRLISYSLNVVPQDLTVASTADLKALVSWSNGFGGGNAKLDVGRGRMFSLPSSWSVIIDVQFNGTGGAFIVEASAAIGAVSALPPLCSVRLGTINNGASSNRLEIPAYARTVELVTNNSAARTNALNIGFFEDNASAALYEALGNVQVKEAIISGAELFNVTNTTGAALSVIAIFELELG